MNKVTKQMTIAQILNMDRSVAPIFFEFGMFCLGCPSATGESLEDACLVHGIDVDPLIDRLNEHLGANQPKA